MEDLVEINVRRCVTYGWDCSTSGRDDDLVDEDDEIVEENVGYDGEDSVIVLDE